MNKAILAISFFYVASVCYAEDEKLITVMNFKTNGVSEQEMSLYVDFMSSEISGYPDYILVERQQREEYLKEITFSNSGCVDESCQIEIGRLLSATEMVIGSMGSFGSFYVVNLKLIDVETGKSVHAISKRYSGMDELIIEVKNIVAELFDYKRLTANIVETVVDEYISTQTEESVIEVEIEGVEIDDAVIENDLVTETGLNETSKELQISRIVMEDKACYWDDIEYKPTSLFGDYPNLVKDVLGSADHKDELLEKMGSDYIFKQNIAKTFFVFSTGYLCLSIIFFIAYPDSEYMVGPGLVSVGISGIALYNILKNKKPAEFIAYYNQNNPF